MGGEMSKHTPAPWTYDKEAGRVLAGGNRICGINGYLNDQGNANARLIAAAPAMLDVLDAWSNAHWLAGVEAVQDSNDPLEALLYRTRMAIHDALKGGAA
jgi:hypothetical protein